MQYSRYDQERFAAGREDTAGFRIDTMSSYHGKGLASMVGGGASAGDGAKSNDRSIPDNTAMMPPPTPAHETPRGARTPRDPRAMGLGTPGPGGLTPDPCMGFLSILKRSRYTPLPSAHIFHLIVLFQIGVHVLWCLGQSLGRLVYRLLLFQLHQLVLSP